LGQSHQRGKQGRALTSTNVRCSPAAPQRLSLVMSARRPELLMAVVSPFLQQRTQASRPHKPVLAEPSSIRAVLVRFIGRDCDLPLHPFLPCLLGAFSGQSPQSFLIVSQLCSLAGAPESLLPAGRAEVDGRSRRIGRGRFRDGARVSTIGSASFPAVYVSFFSAISRV